MNTIKNKAIYSILARASAIFLLQTGAASAWAGIPVEHWTHDSGAQIYLVQSPSIPMVDVQLDFDAGARRDPVAKVGLASATAAMTSKGVRASAGDKALDENALGEAWADLGASLAASATSDRMSFALRTLTYPDILPRAVQLAARQLAAPAFPADVWRRERASWVAGIDESKTRPATVAELAFNKAVYGNHPYGYETTPQTLAQISVADMKALYASAITPCRAKITLVGAVNREQAQTLVTQLLARFAPPTGACPALPPVPDVQALQKASEQAIAFDAAQAQVLLGQPGFKRDHPQYFPLTVGNYILGGGGFVSRLTEEVREKRGLSYSVYSYFSPALHAGAFTIGLQTRPDQARAALAVSREVLANFVASGPTDAELKAAKDFMVGGFALRIDSNRKLLDNVSNIAWNNLPLDYLDTWRQQVEKVSKQDITQAFAALIKPDHMATVVLGATP